MDSFGTRLVAATLIALSLAGCSSSQKTKPADAKPVDAKVADAKPLSAEDSILTSVTATVQAINHATREVTLKGPNGNTVTFTVDSRVKRLNEINVGDEVTANYYVSLARELRAPTAEEKAHPIAVVEGAARAPEGTEPAAGGLRIIRVVTTVEAIDLPKQSITLKGPEGNAATFRAKSLDNLKKVKVGDTIIVTYTEGLAISVEKVGAGKK